MNGSNRHCCVLSVEGLGLLIEGPSGSGKTSLMFGLLERFAKFDVSSEMISDDQALIERSGEEVIASAPPSIQGKAEVRGYGIVPVSAATRPVAIGLVVTLVADEDIERMPGRQTTNLIGCDLDHIKVPMRHEAGAIRIILAWLRDNTDIALPSPGS